MLQNSPSTILIILAIVAYGCAEENIYHSSESYLDSCLLDSFVYENFEILELPDSLLPYVSMKTIIPVPRIRDDNGVVLHRYQEKLDYHPVAIAAYAIDLLDFYTRTKDSVSLQLAIINADKLYGVALAIDSALLFPYTFDYNFQSKDKMRAPWYSGMAQGKVLSLFSRLAKIFPDGKYEGMADKVFNSFYRLKGAQQPWISCIDKNQNIWLEEYPNPQPSHVLNGMIYAIFGIYDYYLLNKSEKAKVLLKATITTIKKNIHLYRDPKAVSYYCIKYNVKNPDYHPTHVMQLRMLASITRESYFDDIAQKMENDVIDSNN